MHWIWVCMGGGTTPANTSVSMAAAAASLSFTASAARRSAHVTPPKCRRVGYLRMPKSGVVWCGCNLFPPLVSEVNGTG
jgi:hypothetical protein